jgi:putative hydrolase of the HAD superfamily
MRPSVVFFDFGGTLVRTWVSEGRPVSDFYDVVLRQRGFAIDPRALSRALEEVRQRFGGRIYEYLGHTREFWRENDAQVLDRLGIRSQREGLLEDLDREVHRASAGVLYPETLPTLEALRQSDLPLGVISGHNDTLPGILAQHGILRYFRTVTYSQEAGAEKPDRRVFDLALRRAGCEPAEAVYVGDSWATDYLGARAVGMRAIWLNRRQAPPPEACEAVEDLAGVLALLG